MGMVGFLLRVSQSELEEYMNDSKLLESRLADEELDEDKLVDIDKAWDGIIYLLTGEGFATSEHPMRNVIFSGQLVHEEQDLGYGPAHYNTPGQVAELSTLLDKIDAADLRARYNPADMEEKDVYPSVWDEDEEIVTYLLDNFESVRAIYAEAALNGEAVIMFVS